MPSIDSSRWLSRTRRAEALGYLFEPYLPIALEEIHYAYVELEGGQVLLCGLEQGEIDSFSDASTLELCPDELPEQISDAIEELNRLDLQALNLLSGLFLPQPMRRAAHRRRTLIVLLLLTAIVLVGAGLERRIRTNVAAATDMGNQLHNAYRDVLGETRPGQPLELQLIAERRRLEQTRGANAPGVTSLSDAGATLAALLARWPDEHLQTETITITPASVHVQLVTEPDAAQRIMEELSLSESSWKRLQPELSRQQERVRLTLHFDRVMTEAVQ